MPELAAAAVAAVELPAQVAQVATRVGALLVPISGTTEQMLKLPTQTLPPAPQVLAVMAEQVATAVQVA